MIDEIHIRDVALIREATFEPAPGFTVITGETGAGKTALLSALKLLSGDRADAGMVREGQPELCVEGRFVPAGDPESDGLVASRKVLANGRSKVYVDGSLASVHALADGVGAQIDLCGQHEHQRLLQPSWQRTFLDAWGGEAVAVAHEAYMQAFSAAREAAQKLQHLQELSNADATALDKARFTLETIDKVDPGPTEYDDLIAQMPRYEHAETLIRTTHAARELLGEGGRIVENLEQLSAALSDLARIDAALLPGSEQVREALYSLDDLSRTLATYEDSIDFSPLELEQRQERVAQLQSLMRGWGPRMEDVFAAHAQASRTVHEYDSRDELIEQAEADLAAAEEALAAAAADLALARSKVTPRFLEAVCAQMARLEMGSARLEAQVHDLPREQWGTWGSQSFELMFVPGEGLSAQRLAKIASGGELSRVMLAIKVVLGACDTAETLVFDEIDVGVGGQTAVALADVLADLANTHQVIAVTHLPQVAVRAQAHYLVRKLEESSAPQTVLARIEGAARVDEVARMLSGVVDATSRAHAKKLLER